MKTQFESTYLLRIIRWIRQRRLPTRHRMNFGYMHGCEYLQTGVHAHDAGWRRRKQVGILGIGRMCFTTNGFVEPSITAFVPIRYAAAAVVRISNATRIAASVRFETGFGFS